MELFSQDSFIVLLIISSAFVCFLFETPRYDLLAICVLVILVIAEILTPQEAFSSLASTPVIVILALFVFAKAFVKTGAAFFIAQRTSRVCGKQSSLLMLCITWVAGALAGFFKRTAITASWLPALIGTSREFNIAASRLLLPLSFGVLLGGTLTLIGSSTNLVAQSILLSDVAQQKYGDFLVPLGLFEFLPLGLFLLGIGGLFFAAFGKKLLPLSRPEENLTELYQVKKYLTELRVEENSDLVGKSLAESALGSRDQVRVIGVRRDKQVITTPGPNTTLHAHDILLVQSQPENILRVRDQRGLALLEESVENMSLFGNGAGRIIEAVVASGSRLAGRTLGEVNFRSQYGLNVLALWRHGEVYPLGLTSMPIRTGDALLLQGPENEIEQLREDRDFLLTEEVEPPVQAGGKAWLVILIFAFCLVVSALWGINLAIALLGGVALLALCKILTPKEAYESINWSVLVLTIGMLALSTAMIKVGLDDQIVQLLQPEGLLGYTYDLFLLFFFLLATLIAQLTRPMFALAVLAPIALGIAAAVGLSAHGLLVTILVACASCFLSPFAHEVNFMVMGPGGYRFPDYSKAGLPLLFLVGLTTVLLVPVFWSS